MSSNNGNKDNKAMSSNEDNGNSSNSNSNSDSNNSNDTFNIGNIGHSNIVTNTNRDIITSGLSVTNSTGGLNAKRYKVTDSSDLFPSNSEDSSPNNEVSNSNQSNSNTNQSNPEPNSNTNQSNTNSSNSPGSNNRGGSGSGISNESSNSGEPTSSKVNNQLEEYGLPFVSSLSKSCSTPTPIQEMRKSKAMQMILLHSNAIDREYLFQPFNINLSNRQENLQGTVTKVHEVESGLEGTKCPLWNIYLGDVNLNIQVTTKIIQGIFEIIAAGNVPSIEASVEGYTLSSRGNPYVLGTYKFHGERVRTVPRSRNNTVSTMCRWIGTITHANLPENTRRIDDEAFEHCTHLQCLKIPEAVRYVPMSLFQGCKSLKFVDLPAGLLEVEAWAFKDCVSLKAIMIPKTVRKLGISVFSGCKSLQSICIPENCKLPIVSFVNLSEDAFYKCTLLEKHRGRDRQCLLVGWLLKRFKDLPLHHLCYYCTSTEDCNALVESIKNWDKEEDFLSTDAMDMTPLHILCCNFKANHHVFNALVKRCPAALDHADVSEKLPLHLFMECRGLLCYDSLDGPSLLSLFSNLTLYRGRLPTEQLKILLALGINDLRYNDFHPFMMAAWMKDCELETAYNLAIDAVDRLCINESGEEDSRSNNSNKKTVNPYSIHQLFLFGDQFQSKQGGNVREFSSANIYVGMCTGYDKNVYGRGPTANEKWIENALAKIAMLVEEGKIRGAQQPNIGNSHQVEGLCVLADTIFGREEYLGLHNEPLSHNFPIETDGEQGHIEFLSEALDDTGDISKGGKSICCLSDSDSNSNGNTTDKVEIGTTADMAIDLVTTEDKTEGNRNNSSKRGSCRSSNGSGPLSLYCDKQETRRTRATWSKGPPSSTCSSSSDASKESDEELYQPSSNSSDDDSSYNNLSDCSSSEKEVDCLATNATVLSTVSSLTVSTKSTKSSTSSSVARSPSGKKSFKNSNMQTFRSLFSNPSMEEKKGFKEHFLAIFIPSSKYNSKNLMTDVEIPTHIGDFMKLFRKVVVIQRNAEDVVGSGTSNCTLYVARNLHRHIHCGIGTNGIEIMQRTARQKVEVVWFDVNYNIPAPNLHCQQDILVPDVLVLNQKGMKIEKRGKDYLSLVRSTLQTFIKDEELISCILGGASGAKNNRGKILSFHFGSSYSDPTKYKRTSIGGGTLPHLYGYEKLGENVKKAITTFDNALLSEMLPTMGITNAFRDGGQHRIEYNNKIKKALGYSTGKGQPFTLPEAGTFLIYPGGMDHSAMEILQPHVDTFNDSKEGFNYAICIGGTFRVDNVGGGNSALMSLLRKICGVKSTFQFSFIRYSRKCIGDMDNLRSKINLRQQAYNNGNQAQKIIIKEMTKVETHVDYEHVVGLHNVNVYVALFNRFLTDGSNAMRRRGCSYMHGRIITDQLACADKNCYYSAAYDVVLCLYKQYRIKDWDDILSIPVIFTVYCNSTALFVQAVESLLLGQYLGKEFLGPNKVSNPFRQKLPQWAYILSTQLYYENKKRTGEHKLSPSSTHNRSQSTGRASTLPHFKEYNAMENFSALLNGLKGIISKIWANMEPTLTKQGSCLPKSVRYLIYTTCTEMFLNLKKLNGVGGFTAMCLIQFLSGLGIIPSECNFFAAISSCKTGSFKFFQKHVPVDGLSDKATLKAYNDMLYHITEEVRRSTNPLATMMDVENLACEEERKNAKYDLKYHFHFRSTMLNVQKFLTSGNVSGYQGFVGGMQNFFFMRWDSSKKRMRLHLLAAKEEEQSPPTRSGCTKFILCPITKFIHIDGKNKSIDYKDNNDTMPFNVVSNGRNEVKFYNFPSCSTTHHRTHVFDTGESRVRPVNMKSTPKKNKNKGKTNVTNFVPGGATSLLQQSHKRRS